MKIWYLFNNVAIDFRYFWNFVNMKDIIRIYNSTVRFSKFALSTKIYKNIWEVYRIFQKVQRQRPQQEVQGHDSHLTHTEKEEKKKKKKKKKGKEVTWGME